ncbi:Spindle assembly abnormal protein 6-like protein [Trichoplax sp. H2]|nr:Spindle assembly abnormal protein 6-like protein [Trichoplax sp. H2]|eukprot:RDD47801.1 Spindle assembly abnormal protein 6-like protein [Trichoplax sp. H2]
MSTLYQNTILVTVKQANGEDRQVKLSFSIDWKYSGSGRNQQLAIRITDEADPFFILNLTLGEEEYRSLKTQQKLLVDFITFPKSITDLLELCHKAETESIPKYLLVLYTHNGVDQAYPTLDVIETSQFRHLVHLSLTFVPGNDSEVKKHLAQSLKHFKTECGVLKSNLKEMEKNYRYQLEDAKENLSIRNKELETLKSEWNSRLNYLTSTHNNELATEKEKSAIAMQNNQQRYDTERKEIEASHQRMTRQYESKISDLENHNKELLDSKYQSETMLRELKGKYASLENEHKITFDELDKIRKRVSSSNLDLQDKDKIILQLETKLAILNQDIESKGELLHENKALLTTIAEEKQQLGQLCDKRQQMCSKLENENIALTGDIKKANEIIKNLQGSLKASESKIKERDFVTVEQEKIIKEKASFKLEIEKSLQSKKRELQSIRDVVEKKDNEIKSLNDKIEKYHDKLEESKKQLKTNEQLIEYLNKMLNDARIPAQPRPISKYTGSNPVTVDYSRRYHMRNTNSDSALGNVQPRNWPVPITKTLQSSTGVLTNPQTDVPSLPQQNQTVKLEKVVYQPSLTKISSNASYDILANSGTPQNVVTNRPDVKPIDSIYLQKANSPNNENHAAKQPINNRRIDPDIVTGPYTPQSYMSAYFPKDVDKY